MREQLTAVRLEGQWDGVDFSPLLRLPKLDTLDLHRHSLDKPQIRVIKQLALRKLTLYWLTPGDLADLLSPPHSLHQLHDLAMDATYLTAPMMRVLVDQLPQLTRLMPESMTTECVPLLTQLPQLREVLIAFRSADQPFNVHIAPYLAAFGRLRWLELHHCSFDRKEEVAQFASAMPLLETLRLVAVRLPPSLVALASARSLRSLKLDRCPEVHYFALRQLAAYASLRRLEVYLTQRLTAEQLAILYRPHQQQSPGDSACLLSQLEEFEYHHGS